VVWNYQVKVLKRVDHRGGEVARRAQTLERGTSTHVKGSRQKSPKGLQGKKVGCMQKPGGSPRDEKVWAQNQGQCTPSKERKKVIEEKTVHRNHRKSTNKKEKNGWPEIQKDASGGRGPLCCMRKDREKITSMGGGKSPGGVAGTRSTCLKKTGGRRKKRASKKGVVPCVEEKTDGRSKQRWVTPRSKKNNK